MDLLWTKGSEMACSPRLAMLEGGCRALFLALLVVPSSACIGVVDQSGTGQTLDPAGASGTGGATGLPQASATGGSPFILSTGGNGSRGAGTGGANTGGSATGGSSTGGALVDMAGSGGAPVGGMGGGGRAGQRDGGVGSDGSALPPSDGGAVTWTEVYSTLLNNMAYTSNCSGAACHNPGTAKNIKLATSVGGYTSIRAIVTPGTPTTGNLVKVLMSASMPRGRPKMPATDLAKIQAWITAGALNN